MQDFFEQIIKIVRNLSSVPDKVQALKELKCKTEKLIDILNDWVSLLSDMAKSSKNDIVENFMESSLTRITMTRHNFEKQIIVLLI